MPTQPPNTLGDVIREARTSGGTRSLRDFAREMGIAPSYLSDIENNRRVPAEDVLKKIADLLKLNFEELMALAGRFGEEAERYVKRTPAAGTLLRRISEKNLDEKALRKLIDRVEEMGEPEGSS